MQTWMAKLDKNCIFVSARKGINIDSLRKDLYYRVKDIHVKRYPYNDFLYPIYDSDDFDMEDYVYSSEDEDNKEIKDELVDEN